MISKRMVCVQCLDKIFATIVQAKAHGWLVWVGGAHCKKCAEAIASGVGDADPRPLRRMLFATEPNASGDMFVDLECGHRIASREKRVSYPCWACLGKDP